MGGDGVPEWFISELSALRDGDLSDDLTVTLMVLFGLELHSGAIVGSAKVCWVLDIRHERYLRKGFLSTLDSDLRWVNAIQTLLYDWLEGGRRTLMYSIWNSYLDNKWWKGLPQAPSEASIPSYAVVVSAVILLSLVYQYLTGNVDTGGSKAYSRSSLDFRDIYVAIVLFLGAYVWIKFREVAFKGVHPRKLPGKQGGIKVVYDARLTPPLWNGKKVPKLDLGRFATPQEAHTKFLIAAFYYNRDAGLLDGWFQVPPMSEEERSLTGEEKRKWVIGQAKKVYKDFKKEAEEALLQESFKSSEVQATPGHDEVNLDPCGASFLNSAEPHQTALASQAENSGMGMAILANHGLECDEGLALPDGHSLGSQEGSALPVSQLPLNIECLNGSDQLDLLQTVRTQPQQIFLEQNQISDPQEQISLLQQKISLLKQQIQEFRIQNPQWPCPFCLQQQELQDVSQGFPSFEVEMEASMHQLNYPGLMAPPPDGGVVQEAFWEMDALW